ncbi:glycosyltransferase family 10 [Methylobacterium sp. J-078]|uniref:glycosyltransferase family 10 domain-containing protein n=1 Tax=Methylobacterium sp. J-078 TaxID=2836657 RepID=UPI001FBBB8FA|nr:glycosyltransferase family 10 [Methylobacterium sp. J-078]MCJ2043551.1 glycosyltransferase family 10 [Methylobacterium sp. J-078]
MTTPAQRTKVAFKYFFPNFSSSYFFQLFPFLSEMVEVTSESDAELVVFSVWHDIPGVGPSSEDYAVGRFHVMPPIERLPGKAYLFWSGENVLPDMALCDYAITHSYCSHSNHLRLPYWVAALRGNGLTGDDLARSQDNLVPPIADRRDCNFLYSHQVPHREKFALEMMEYFEVVCPGISLHNTSDSVPAGFQGKAKFLSGFNFTIAFENSKDDGYTTEKLIEPLLSTSIPLYWGNERVLEDINSECFIQVDKFSGVQELSEYMRFLLSNEEDYQRIAMAPRFPNSEIPEIATLIYAQKFFQRLLNGISSNPNLL